MELYFFYKFFFTFSFDSVLEVFVGKSIQLYFILFSFFLNKAL